MKDFELSNGDGIICTCGDEMTFVDTTWTDEDVWSNTYVKVEEWYCAECEKTAFIRKEFELKKYHISNNYNEVDY